jgi:hypothetical protein
MSLQAISDRPLLIRPKSIDIRIPHEEYPERVVRNFIREFRGISEALRVGDPAYWSAFMLPPDQNIQIGNQMSALSRWVLLYELLVFRILSFLLSFLLILSLAVKHE